MYLIFIVILVDAESVYLVDQYFNWTFHGWTLIEKQRRGVSGPLRDVLTPHVLALYGSSNKRWPIVTSEPLSAALLCIEQRYKSLPEKKKAVWSDTKTQDEPTGLLYVYYLYFVLDRGF